MIPIGVSLDENREEFSEFVRGTGVDWPQCFVGRTLWDNPVARQFGFRTPSEFVILDASGRVAARGHGHLEVQAALDSVRDLPSQVTDAVFR